MKTIKILMVLMIGTTELSNAQKRITEGTVTYTVTYDLPADKQQYADMLPKEITCYFKGDSTAAIADQGSATIKGVSVISSNYHCLIIDIPSASKKIAVVLTADEVQQEKAGIPEFTGQKGTEKQIIAGYNCVKVPVTDKKSGVSYEIWVTNDIDIPVNSVSRAAGIFGGVPVKFVTFNNGFKINAVIKEVKAMTIADGFFSASKDYQAMSYSDLKSLSN